MSKSIKSEIVTITPARAQEILAANARNRKLSLPALAKLKASLLQGEWVVNGEAIKISATGQLLDGQHRLVACVETGINFTTLVITGLPEEVQDTMDTGKARSLADVLTINGVGDSNNLAALLVALERYDRWGMKIAVAGYSAYPVTVQQALRRFAAEPSLVDAAAEAKKTNRVGLPGKLGGLFLYSFSAIDQEDAEDFFHKLISGEGLERGNPILALRNKLLKMKQDAGSMRNYLEGGAITIKAWNKYRAGEEALVLNYRPGGAAPEAFPEPK